MACLWACDSRESPKIRSNSDRTLAIPYTEIPALDAETGKLVVVMQSHDQHLLHQQMEATRDIDGVIDVSLVYHQQDENE